MPRSLKVHPEYINQVKSAVKRNGYPRQKDLAEDLEISLATVNNFLNGKAVDYLNFIEICQRLAQDWQTIAEFDEALDKHNSIEEQEILSSDFYVERVPYESQCYEAILKPGALIRLKAPQQMGKT